MHISRNKPTGGIGCLGVCPLDRAVGVKAGLSLSLSSSSQLRERCAWSLEVFSSQHQADVYET
jgi:hypothetical protein